MVALVSFNRLEGDSLIQTYELMELAGVRFESFNRLEGDSLIQTRIWAMS